MLTDVELQSLQSLNGILDTFKKSKAEAEKNLKEIDEKYKAIIAKEKESYKQTISACEKEIKFWEKPIVRRYGKTLEELLANPEGAVESEDKEDDELPFSEDEKVVDKEAEEEPVAETVTEEPAEEPVPVEEIPAEEPVSEGDVAEAKEEDDDDWEEKTEAEAQDDNDGWGTDFPAEWK